MLSTLQAEPANRVHSESDSERFSRLTKSSKDGKRPSLHYNSLNYEDFMQVVRRLRSDNEYLEEPPNNSAINNKVDPEPASEDAPIMSSAVNSAPDPPGADLGSRDGNFTDSHYIHKLICI